MCLKSSEQTKLLATSQMILGVNHVYLPEIFSQIHCLVEM